MITIDDIVVWCERQRAQLDDELRLLGGGMTTSTNSQNDTDDTAIRVRDRIAELDALLARYGTHPGEHTRTRR